MTERERFVPHRVSELTDALWEREQSSVDSQGSAAGKAGPDGVVNDPAVNEDDAASWEIEFRGFSRLLAGLFHFEFYDREQLLLEAWESVASGQRLDTHSATAQAASDQVAADYVTAELSGLLDAASYAAVTMEELDEALETESLIPLRLEVDLDDYDEVLIYRRGAHTDSVEIKKLFGLRKESKEILVDERVVIHTRVKPQEWFDQNGIDAADRNLIPGHVGLKQFQDVPRADIEMLLPSTQVRFRLLDSLLIGIPALAGGIAVLATKLLPTIGLILLLTGAWIGVQDETPSIDQAALVILFGGVLALGSFGMRQWTKMKNRKVDYLKTLSENLYFRTLANGAGVLHTLLSSAEQQEVAEVLLAYHFLADHPTATISQLDEMVEAWLEEQMGLAIDFDVEDAVLKLRALEILEGHRRLQVLPLSQALIKLDQRWDSIFVHPEPGQRLSLLGSDRAPTLVRLRQVVGRFRGGAAKRTTVRQA